MNEEHERVEEAFKKLFRENSFVSLKHLTRSNTHNNWTINTLHENDFNPEFLEKFDWFMKEFLSQKLKPLQIIDDARRVATKKTIKTDNLYGVLESLIERLATSIAIDFKSTVHVIKSSAVEQKIEAQRKELARLLIERANSSELLEWEHFRLDLKNEIGVIVTKLAEEVWGNGLEFCLSQESCLRQKEPSLEDAYRLMINPDFSSRLQVLEIANGKKIEQFLNDLGQKKHAELLCVKSEKELEDWRSHIEVPPFLKSRAEEKLGHIFQLAKTQVDHAKNMCYVKLGQRLLIEAEVEGIAFETSQDLEDHVVSFTLAQHKKLLQVIDSPKSSLLIVRVSSDYISNKSLPSFFLEPQNTLESELSLFVKRLRTKSDECLREYKHKEYVQVAEQFLVGILPVLPSPPYPFSCEEYLKILSKVIEDHTELRPYSLKSRLEAAALRVAKSECEILTKTEVQSLLDSLTSSWTFHFLPPDLKARVVVNMPTESHKEKQSVVTRLRVICGESTRITAHDHYFECAFQNEDAFNNLITNATLPWIKKITRGKTSRIIVKNGQKLSDLEVLEEMLIVTQTNDEIVPVSQPTFFEDYCCLAFDSPDVIESFLAVQTCHLASSGNLEFMETFKVDVDAKGLELAKEYLIHSEKIADDIFRCELFPSAAIHFPAAATGPSTPSKPSTPSTPSAPSSPSSPSTSSPSHKCSFRMIPSKHISNLSFRELIEAEVKLNDLGDLSRAIWDEVNFHKNLKETIASSQPNQQWNDPSSCSLRIVAGAVTKKISVLKKYSVLPAELIGANLPMSARHNVSNLVQNNPDLLLSAKQIDFPSRPKEATQKVILRALNQRRSQRTMVAFEACDTLICAKNCIDGGKKVLALNMANEKTPGGGWLHGRMAQEEELFRRTDLSTSLPSSLYPLAERTALFTPSVCVFRGTADEGYPFLENPFCVDIISAAAFNNTPNSHFTCEDPVTNKRVFRRSIISRTFYKIQNIIHFAAQKEYDVVVLGAIGCGAFNNPREDIARIFHEVLSIYAGAIPEIKFAIMGEVNLETFKNNIRKEYCAPKFALPAPFTGQNACAYGGVCNDDVGNHKAESYHPPACPDDRKCPLLNDRIHSACMVHSQNCPQGSLCTRFYDKAHKARMIHPGKCNSALTCNSDDAGHFKEFWHPPTCSEGLTCPRYIKNDNHGERHVAINCPQGIHCRNWMNNSHRSTYTHPFLEPCKYLLNCNDTSPAHMEEFSHVCHYGGACKHIALLNDEDKKHCKFFYHFTQHDCPQERAGLLCKSLLDELHLETYTHKDIKDIRPPCVNGENCPQRGSHHHVKQFSHPRLTLTTIAPVNPLTLDIGSYCGGGISVPKGALSADEIEKRIPFFSNAKKSFDLIGKHLNNPNVTDPAKNSNWEPVVERVRSARPIHRLSSINFKGVCTMGALLSLHQIRNFTVESTLPLVLSHPDVVPLLLKKDKSGAKSKDFIVAYIAYLRSWLQYEEEKSQASIQPTVKEEDVKKLKSSYTRRRSVIVINISEEWVAKLESKIEGIVRSTRNLQLKSVSYSVDEQCGTDKTVFSVVGPHNGKQYGHIYLILHPSIKWHPNFYVLPNAATFFHSKRYHEGRPWVTSSEWATGGKTDLQDSKFHPIAPQTSHTQALDLIARTAAEKKRDPMSVTLKDVYQWWESRESHLVFEGHLPYQVPISYIECVIMSNDIWEKDFDDDGRAMFSRLFPHKIVKTKSHEESYSKATKRCLLSDLNYLNGFCFILAPTNQKGDELFVPLKLVTKSKSNRTMISFEATGSNFVLCLVNQEKMNDKRDSLSIVFKDKEVSIVSVPPLSAFDSNPKDPKSKVRPYRQVSETFNKGLRPGKIQYKILLDYNENTITVSHGGPSEVYSFAPPLQYDVSKTTLNFRSLEFFSLALLGSEAVEIYNLRTGVVENPVMTKYQPPPPASAQHTPQKSAQPGLFQKVYNFVTGNSSPPAEPSYSTGTSSSTSPPSTGSAANQLRMCPKDQQCSAMDPVRYQDHVKQYVHTCRFGQQCHDSSPDHIHRFVHRRKAFCSAGAQCDQTFDPVHRASVAHQELWDYMIPCNQTTCADFSKSHRQRYSHK
eukprot:TRINITY_DN6444_c0_g2_i2.p1 TRINITY_DN6444_c0_g2~~TRINITY_DN6444_c0_g2_i2.p1  ORF type:complete len:2395 (-),score=354.39 TRINITY_DN6444_c0_g2_i2:44-6298(-)